MATADILRWLMKIYCMKIRSIYALKNVSTPYRSGRMNVDETEFMPFFVFHSVFLSWIKVESLICLQFRIFEPFVWIEIVIVSAFFPALAWLARNTSVAHLPHWCFFCGTLVWFVNLASEWKGLSDIGERWFVVVCKRLYKFHRPLNFVFWNCFHRFLAFIMLINRWIWWNIPFTIARI